MLEELTDDDVLEGEDDEEDDDEEGSARAAVVAYATALVDAQLVELVIDNLSRLHEDEEEAERSGVYHTLGLIENLLSLKPELSSHIAKKTKFIEWLLRRMMPPTKTKLAKANDNQTAGAKEKEKAREEDAALAQNRQYAAELLAIILQGVEVGGDARLEFGRSGGIASALKVLSVSSILFCGQQDFPGRARARRADFEVHESVCRPVLPQTRPERGGRDRVYGERLWLPLFGFARGRQQESVCRRRRCGTDGHHDEVSHAASFGDVGSRGSIPEHTPSHTSAGRRCSHAHEP